MSINVLIFGMAHSGKSTLMGYMVAHDKNLDIEDLSREFKKKYGKDYDSSQDYAYIVNTNKDEIIKTDKGTSGSTKANHIKRIKLKDHNITIIDTPGVEHKEKERTKGMFYSDIGVFCIEITQIIDNNFYTKGRLNHIVSQLMLWTHFKKEKIIVLLTKSDLVEYSQEKYNEAVKIINFLCDEIRLEPKIIPISINVSSRNAHNVINKSTKMLWYDSESFYSILESELEIYSHQEDKQLLFHIDRQYKKTEHSGKSWRIKILEGSLNVGDRITMAPVKIGNEEGAISCNIKSIRYDINKDEKPVQLDSVDSGNIVGIDINDVKFNKRTITKDDFNAQYTTCGFSSEKDFIIAKYAIVDISKIYKRHFSVDRQMSFLWFGRAIAVKILTCTQSENEDYLRVEFEFLSRKVALPTKDNKLYIESVIIDTSYQKSEDVMLNTQNRFIDGELISLSENKDNKI